MSGSNRPRKQIPRERGRLRQDRAPGTDDGYDDNNGYQVEPVAAEVNAAAEGVEHTARFVWGAAPPPLQIVMPPVTTAVVPPTRPGKQPAAQVLSEQDYPVPVVNLPNKGVVSLLDAAPLELDGSYSIDPDFTSFLTSNVINPAMAKSPDMLMSLPGMGSAGGLAGLGGASAGSGLLSGLLGGLATRGSGGSGVNYNQQFQNLAQVPGQVAGASKGYSTGLMQQGVQQAQGLANTIQQQSQQSLSTSNQPLTGGNKQPVAVQGLGQDPNTYLLGGSDYYPGGSNGYGQTGGLYQATPRLPGQGVTPATTGTPSINWGDAVPGISAAQSAKDAQGSAGQGLAGQGSAGQGFAQPGGGVAGYSLTSGQLVSSTNLKNQYAGGQLDSGGQFIGANPNAGGTFDPSTGQFVGSPPGQGQVPNGFYWTGGYWGYCPPPSPPVAAPAPPPPPGILGTRAIIR
eukprot:gene9831-9990_t